MVETTLRKALKGGNRRGGTYLITLLCAAACLALAGWNWLLVRTTLQQNVDARFDLRTTAVTDKLTIALSTYRDAVHNASVRLESAPMDDENAWRAYVQNLRLAERLPGLVTFGTCERSGDRIRRAFAYAVGEEAALGPDGSIGMPKGTSPVSGVLALPGAPGKHSNLVFFAGGAAPANCTYAIANVDSLVHAAAGPLIHDIVLTIGVAQGTAPPTRVFDSLSPRAPAEPRPNIEYRSQATIPYNGATTLPLTYSASPEFATLRGTGVANWTLALGLLTTALTAIAWAFVWRERRRATIVGAGHLEGRLYSVIQSVREAIITIDDQQRIQIFNPTAEAIFQCDAMEAIGEPLSRFIPERFRDAHAGHIERFGLTGTSERLMGRGRPLWGLRANGEEFPMEASISQSIDASGKFYSVVLRDVSEQRRIAAALQTSRNDLEKLSARLQEVREDEKLRIARELHDDLGQRLTALKMDAAMLTQSLAEDMAARDEARRIEQSIDAMIAAVRRMAADLRPPMLDDLGLGPAIEWYVQDFSRRYGVAVDCTGTRNLPPIPAPVATALFRIVQEGLNNVAKHARATSATIELTCARECRLKISDNGRGLPPTRPKPDALGLISMRERARLLGGTLEVRSPTEGGTVVTTVIPLPTQPTGQEFSPGSSSDT